jgi:hypothetical protein
MKTYIGIDPGVSTGFAVVQSEGQKVLFYELHTLSFWQCFEKMMFWHVNSDKYNCEVIIEDPGLNKPIFYRNQSGAAMNRISQNVGSNKRDAQLWIEFCEFYGIKYAVVRPTKTKLNAGDFARIYNIQKSCSQHARDAFRLVGMRV